MPVESALAMEDPATKQSLWGLQLHPPEMLCGPLECWLKGQAVLSLSGVKTLQVLGSS